MQQAGLNSAAMNAFRYNFLVLTSGKDLNIPESTISAVSHLPKYEDLKKENASLLQATVMVKLNGGLGTGMGLDKAKSLLPLKGKDTFLDFIAQQAALHSFDVPSTGILLSRALTGAGPRRWCSCVRNSMWTLPSP